MKLSTQLARGVLALPMLFGFGLLAVAGVEPTTAQAADQVASATDVQAARVRAEARRIAALDAAARASDARAAARSAALHEALSSLSEAEVAADALGQVARLCEARTGPRVLLLSQAPGDLGRLAVRFSHPCRA
jgi:hypothetical protein